MKKREGFTLVELLIVVAIIAIVTGIAVPNVMSARIRARISGAKSEMGSIAIVLEDYKMDSGGYPLQYDNNYDRIATGMPLTGGTAQGLGKLIYPTSSDSTPVYLSTIPEDPFNNNDKPGGYYSYFTSGNECWALVSWGPDKNNDVASYADAKTAVENGTTYDQSKGLTTTGDIVIIGP